MRQARLSARGLSLRRIGAIEILSPDQKATRVTRNLLHYLRHGCQLGWLIDPAERVVLVFRPEQLPDEMMREDILPSLPGVTLNLTVERLFSWLKAR